MYDLATGRAVDMPSGYDEFSDRAFPLSGDGPLCAGGATACAVMEAEGFAVYSAEWWHFDYRDWKKYPVLNVALEKTIR